ncbi:MAG: YjbE family putative metal transport protein [Alphaproteobacteria bacterium]|nr:YjbE family putative metal transport protein [Alphaproteobacteria bacterium]
MLGAFGDTDMTQGAFWLALAEITGLNLLLSGDNAVVIAMASRMLPPAQRRLTVLLGSIAATLLRILFCAIITYLLAIPYLRMLGGLGLLWIGIQLLLPANGPADTKAKPDIWGAVMTIAVADTVMSLDNAMAIGAVARGDVTLIVLGLAISVPMIVAGSQIILGALLRFPGLVYAGAGLLGWIAGEMIGSDEAVARWTGLAPATLEDALRTPLAALVIGVGILLNRRARRRDAAARAAS